METALMGTLNECFFRTVFLFDYNNLFFVCFVSSVHNAEIGSGRMSGTIPGETVFSSIKQAVVYFVHLHAACIDDHNFCRAGFCRRHPDINGMGSRIWIGSKIFC